MAIYKNINGIAELFGNIGDSGGQTLEVEEINISGRINLLSPFAPADGFTYEAYRYGRLTFLKVFVVPRSTSITIGTSGNMADNSVFTISNAGDDTDKLLTPDNRYLYSVMANAFGGDENQKRIALNAIFVNYGSGTASPNLNMVIRTYGEQTLKSSNGGIFFETLFLNSAV